MKSLTFVALLFGVSFSQVETPESYVSNVQSFNAWAPTVRVIAIESRYGIIFPDVVGEDYRVTNHATESQDFGLQRSYITDVEKNTSHHIFSNNFTNDVSVSFYPMQQMVGVKADFPPDIQCYFYEIYIFYRTKTNIEGTDVFSGIINVYTKETMKDLCMISSPIKVVALTVSTNKPPKKKDSTPYF